MVNVRRDVDWQTIKNSYRCATSAVRVLADIHGVSEGTFRARAKREGWQRDLARAVRQRVREMLTQPELYPAQQQKSAPRALPLREFHFSVKT
jgi:hypothetical protein